MKRGTLFVISAPSGAGKTTLVTEALKRLNSDMTIERHITYTTRAPRDGEVNGKDYVFVSKEEFLHKIREGFFLETTEYNGHLYGSPRSASLALELGKSLVLVTDHPGIQSVKQEIPDAITIWVNPPNFETLKKRMIGRKSETHAQLERRLELAQEEMELERKKPLCKYHLVNDDFDRAVAELCLLIKNEESS